MALLRTGAAGCRLALAPPLHLQRGIVAADEVHPTEAGYRVMAPIVSMAIAQALK
ncbi:MAG: hypothetical protein MUF00_11790 [Gemmatimonadaceae bacterium]|nr:hypothetical protein [Gemmatimonadaceae bacterium]